jgi:hypothetical protein
LQIVECDGESRTAARARAREGEPRRRAQCLWGTGASMAEQCFDFANGNPLLALELGVRAYELRAEAVGGVGETESAVAGEDLREAGKLKLDAFEAQRADFKSPTAPGQPGAKLAPRPR